MIVTSNLTDNLLDNILNTSIHGVIVVEAVRDTQSEIVDFRYVFVNKAAREHASVLKFVQLGMTMREVLADVDFKGVLPVCRMVCLTGQPYEGERYYSDTNEWFNTHFARLDDHQLVITFTNITAFKGAVLKHKQDAELFRQINRNLQQSNDNLQQFAYIASHDLQEPLRKIQSFGALLQSQFGEQLGPTGNNLIERMQAASGRMTTLIQDLLTYSRLTTHRQDFQPVSLGRLISEIVDDLDLLLQEGQALVECHDLPTVLGDASQLRQLFQNLLINSVKFRKADQPPVIHVRCRTLSSNEVPSVLSPESAYVEISVIDNGIGFDERYVDRIFQMFQRLHGRSQYDGTGVGLAICKRVAENHHGLITANSVPGEGATFRVILPI